MVNTETEVIKKPSKKKIIKEDIQFQYFWYLFVLFTIILISYLIPTILFMVYFLLYFIPSFLEAPNFLSIFINLKPLLALITMPLVIIGCYLIRLFLIAIVARFFWALSEKKSPSQPGIIPRNFPSRTLNYYHIRSFILKYPKNAFNKGIFPWLQPWLYNFIKASQIGKGTTIEESSGTDKFLKIGENVYLGVNSVLSSHMIDGIFGNITYFKVKVGDNVTAAAKNLIAPGTEIKENSYLLPIASTPKHSILKGNSYYFSGGARPLSKISKRKVRNYLKIDPDTLKEIEDVKDANITLKDKMKDLDDEKGDNLAIDFVTSSAISRVNIKFLILYIPIFWLSGMLDSIIFYTYTYYIQNPFFLIFFLPTIIIFMWFIFIVCCLIFSKLFLILINLIHKPKEGVFKAEKGDTDFEFWCLRTELKKIVLWLVRNWPIPWMDILVFKWFGIKMSLSISLYDAWCDTEFINFGRKVLIGQGATVMSSMVIGKYLIIKKVIFDDYVLIGGETTIAPGTIVGKETLVGALSYSVYNQILEPGWVYFGMPIVKLKKNKYAEKRRNKITKRDVDAEKKFDVDHDINIDDDKKDLI
jgi:acetyltransferase-like isoleucine patch superfamily enzyme